MRASKDPMPWTLDASPSLYGLQWCSILLCTSCENSSRAQSFVQLVARALTQSALPRGRGWGLRCRSGRRRAPSPGRTCGTPLCLSLPLRSPRCPGTLPRTGCPGDPWNACGGSNRALGPPQAGACSDDAINPNPKSSKHVSSWREADSDAEILSISVIGEVRGHARVGIGS